MKKTAIICMMLCSVVLGATAQIKVSVLGDSYSTYGGFQAPEWNLAWYNGTDGGPNKQNDVDNVDQMWWKIFIDRTGGVLECNNSFSGSTICCTGYGGNDYSDRTFISRIYNLGNPDIIFVFGGTNDSWAKAPVGEYKYENFTAADLMQFRPAFAYMLSQMKMLYPEAKIVNIINSELSDEVTESMTELCEKYGVTNVLLHDIDKQWGHPSQAGMKSIADQLLEVVTLN